MSNDLTERQRKIIEDIKDEPRTARFLMAHHEISRGTLGRDLRAIRKMGFEVEGQRKEGTFTYHIGGREDLANNERKLAETLEGLTQEQREYVIGILEGTNPTSSRKIILPYSDYHVRFGVISDTHMTSTFFNKGCLDYLYKRFKDEGAEFVTHSGDFTDGENMHRGQQNHLRIHGFMNVLDLIANEYPDVGIPTYYVIGNHDYTFYKQNGAEIGVLLEKWREDMIYIGRHNVEMGFEGDLHLGPKEKTVVKLLHPGKGTAYAQSYQPQKIVEGFDGNEKPNVVLVGHYHKMDYVFNRNVHAFQVGTTQDQTEWMRTKGLHAQMGGILIDLYMKDNGTIDRLTYKMIREGW